MTYSDIPGFNTLYLGAPEDVADQLENFGSDDGNATPNELRLALINALRRIAILEKRMHSHAPDAQVQLKE